MAHQWFPRFKEGLPRVDGKAFAITGTTQGLGHVAAWVVAGLGGEVLLLNRKSARVEDSLRDLKAMAPDGKFVNIECDLQDFESVRRAAAEIKAKYRKLYCLSLNAGIVAMPDKATKDGFDVQMQTNHLSHFLLAAELMPLLAAEAQESGDARIVTHTSMGRLHTRNRCLEEKYFGRNGGNLGGNSTDFMGDGCFARYFQTKLANTVFTYSLHEKLKKRGSKVRSISAHPGGSQTNFADHLPHMASSVSTFQSQEDGSMGLLTAMVSLDAQSGVLYGPKGSGMSGPAVPNAVEAVEVDPRSVALLWRASEAATGVSFPV